MTFMPGMVKICGLRDVEHALVAAEAGASALGFILAPSRRQVTPELLNDVRAQLAASDSSPQIVAVVVNEPEAALHEIVERSRPDVVQFSGDEDAAILHDLEAAAFRTVRVQEGATLDEVRYMIDPWLDHACPVEAVLIEAQSPGHFGGTGRVADWELAARLGELYPLILAGGLTPENVGAGIARVRPSGVDVASGVEVDGVKSAERIREFIDVARRGFHAAQAAEC